MIRIFGTNLNNKKKIYLALTDIYGIGLSLSKLILKELNLNPNNIVKEMNIDDLNSIIKLIETKGYKTEGNLRKFNNLNIKRLIDIKSYRGNRHKKGLPVNGQRTRTNSRTVRRNMLSLQKK